VKPGEARLRNPTQESDFPELKRDPYAPPRYLKRALVQFWQRPDVREVTVEFRSDGLREVLTDQVARGSLAGLCRVLNGKGEDGNTGREFETDPMKP
jgi:hypothetical protein